MNVIRKELETTKILLKDLQVNDFFIFEYKYTSNKVLFSDNNSIKILCLKEKDDKEITVKYLNSKGELKLFPLSYINELGDFIVKITNIELEEHKNNNILYIYKGKCI